MTWITELEGFSEVWRESARFVFKAVEFEA
jgi:hypothetical protein